MKKLLRRAVYSFANRLFIVFQNAQRNRLTGRFKSCGQNVSLYMPIRIDEPENVEIGDNVGIGPFVHMWGGGGIKIGNGVMIGSHTAIASEGHDHYAESMKGTLMQKQVIIEDDVAIGTHCVILMGVTLGKGSLVGAGSVVVKNVEPFSIVVTGRKREEWPRRLVGRRRVDSGKPSTYLSEPESNE